ncbi:unnamed protein product [Closterium sp. NIES-64]|nr:unnamed protein product [Closterium sp. NIES-64]CAI5954714.1 unnamed protein product [Closterium sp. NIES-64]
MGIGPRTWHESGFTCTVSDTDHSTGARVRLRDGTRLEAKSTLVTLDLAWCMTAAVSKEWSEVLGLQSDPVWQYKHVIQSHEWQVEDTNWHVRTSLIRPSNDRLAELEWTGDVPPGDLDWLRAVEYVAEQAGCGDRMQWALDALFMRSVRVADVPVVYAAESPGPGHVYLPKPNGESAWLIDNGCLWVLCRTDPSLTVIGHYLKSQVNVRTSKPDIVRCEWMPDGQLIAIGHLAIGQEPVPVTRPYAKPWPLVDILDCPPCLYRRHELSLGRINRLLDAEPLPCDGVIAIDCDTSLTYRIKQPEIDLLVTRDGLMARGTGTDDLVKVGSLDHVPVDQVIDKVAEYALALDKDNVVRLKPLRIRSDKALPNAIDVVQDALAVMQSSPGEDLTFRRRLTAASFNVRDYVYSRSYDARRRLKAIVDVGTGRFQAASAFRAQNTRWLFIDPDLDEDRARKLGAVSVPLNDDSVRAMVSELTGRGRRLFYCKCTLRDLLALDEFMRWLELNSVPVVAAFSAQHVVRELRQLSRAGVPVLGCCYVYDAANDHGYVIRQGDVVMRRDDDDTATATIGPDTFHEPAVVRL